MKLAPGTRLLLVGLNAVVIEDDGERVRLALGTEKNEVYVSHSDLKSRYVAEHERGGHFDE